jgi:lysozyme family protein
VAYVKVDRPDDPGGRTNKGVTFRVYDTWRKAQGLATRDVRSITDDEVSAIYRTNYWEAARCDRLPWPTAMLQFDTAVNMGVGRAVRFLQQSLDIAVDGGFGKDTAAAVSKADQGDLAIRYCSTREDFYNDLVAQKPAMNVFLHGWMNRLNSLRRAAGLPGRESTDPADEAPEITGRVPDDSELNPDNGRGPLLEADLSGAAHADLRNALNEVERLAGENDSASLTEATQLLRQRLLVSGVLLPEARTVKLLATLRGARRFAEMRDIAAALITSGTDRLSVRREYAQALIDSGEILPATDMLERLLASNPAQNDQADIASLLGRAWKQLFVQGRPAAGATAQRNAIRWYEAGLQHSPDAGSQWQWPAINMVALTARARRDNVDPGSAVDPLALAQRILNARGDASEPWDFATLAEASIAVGNWPNAERWVRAYLGHAQTDAFMVASTLRQLTEIWQLSTEPGGMGGDIVAALRADLLRREGGALTLTADQLGELSSTPRATLQRVLGEPGIVTWEWMRTGLARAAAVGVVRRPDGRGIGTGFLVRGGDLHRRLGDEQVFLTNAHVLSRDPTDRPAIAAADAEVLFEAAPGRPAFRVTELIWSSPVEALDACIARLEPPPTLTPCPVADAPLTTPPTQDDGVGAQDPSHRLYIIGHPLGGQLSFSIQDNLLLDHEGPPGGVPGLAGRVLLHYRTPTEPGSSGSPVFEPVGWRVVALHHAGGLIMRRLNGRIGTYAANEGIWIGSIRNALSEL